MDLQGTQDKITTYENSLMKTIAKELKTVVNMVLRRPVRDADGLFVLKIAEDGISRLRSAEETAQIATQRDHLRFAEQHLEHAKLELGLLLEKDAEQYQMKIEQGMKDAE